MQDGTALRIAWVDNEEQVVHAVRDVDAGSSERRKQSRNGIAVSHDEHVAGLRCFSSGGNDLFVTLRWHGDFRGMLFSHEGSGSLFGANVLRADHGCDAGIVQSTSQAIGTRLAASADRSVFGIRLFLGMANDEDRAGVLSYQCGGYA